MRIDVATEPRTGSTVNEDFAAAAAAGDGGALVVLDGVSGADAGCRHGVAWFAARLGAHLLDLARTDPTRPLADCLAAAVQHTADAHGGGCDLTATMTPQSTVVAARWGSASVEYLVLSDSTLALQAPDGDLTVVVDRLRDRMSAETLVQSDELDAALRRAAPGSPEYLRTQRERQRIGDRMRNAEGGFFTAAADPGVAARARTGTVPRGEVAALAALTDGASAWVDAFGIGDWADCFGVLRTAGADGLVAAVREAERSADAATARRGKKSDDASAVFVRF